MPQAAKKLTPGRPVNRPPGRTRPTAADRGYGYQWQKARLIYLALHPLCVLCQASERSRAATVIDHITPHRGNRRLFWDEANWQPLCKQCHDAKTGGGL